MICAIGCASSSSPSDGGSSDSGTSSGRTKTGECPTSGCTEAEQNDYATCLTTACDAQYKDCLGSSYMSGTWGGKCQAYMTCNTACSCSDTACRTACGLPSADCTACFVTLGKCTSSAACTAPKCASADGGVGDGGLVPDGATGKTCADLKTCCDAIADATKKASCTAAYNQASGLGDIACNASYLVQVAQGNCK